MSTAWPGSPPATMVHGEQGNCSTTSGTLWRSCGCEQARHASDAHPVLLSDAVEHKVEAVLLGGKERQGAGLSVSVPGQADPPMLCWTGTHPRLMPRCTGLLPGRRAAAIRAARKGAGQRRQSMGCSASGGHWAWRAGT